MRLKRGGRLDIQALLNDGIIVNIEMQVRDLDNIEQRNEIYVAKTISRHFLRKEKYENAKKVISINILNYNLFGFEEYISETVTVLEKHRDYKVNSILKTYYIELPKFREADVDMDEKQNQWLAFIDDMDRGKIEMAEKKNKIIKEAKIEMNYLTGEAEVRRLAELMDKWESDRASEISCATRKGLQQGEKKKQIEIATKMLRKNINMQEIMELTGLEIEEINKLKMSI